MYVRLLFIYLIALFSVSGGGAPPARYGPVEASPSELQILRISLDFNRAFLSTDRAQYFGSADDDLTVFTPSNPYRVDGMASGRKEFEYGLLTGSTRDVFFQGMHPKVQLFGGAAVVTFFSRVSFNQQGEARTVYWKITDVLVNRDGSWKVVHLHVSTSGKD